MESDVVQTQDQTSLIKAKGKQVSNLIVDVAQEIENLTKTKALNLAPKLMEDIDTNFFRLGGVLKMILENSWFDGYEKFENFVDEKFGFKKRKADYLIKIYSNLVSKQIPWEKVSGLGWTKLKELTDVLTQDNVDEWVSKVEGLSFTEMMAVLNAQAAADGTSKKGTSDTHKFVFTLKADQLEVLQQALAKAKGESGTEFDSTAIELIATGYLANSISLSGNAMHNAMKAMGAEAATEFVNAIWPELNFTIASSDPPF